MDANHHTPQQRWHFHEIPNAHGYTFMRVATTIIRTWIIIITNSYGKYHPQELPFCM